MAETGLTRMPVVERDDPTRLLSVISLRDLLGARVQALEEERERERTLRIRTFIPRQFHLRRIRHAATGGASDED
jgi:CBS domain containing-hemolysin-like protein